jgi:hypothetical protein
MTILLRIASMVAVRIKSRIMFRNRLSIPERTAAKMLGEDRVRIATGGVPATSEAKIGE